mmetsp:Transcript_58369/g.68168  ORF Transcript_58369/g.68168 Transcript_58369/m.68168 type:complete len:297 (-) Transcript_58369:213-1103(-)
MSKNSKPKSTDYSFVEAKVVTAISYFDQHSKSISPENAALTNLPHITWNDDFFDDDEDIIAVFDFSYDDMEQYYTDLGFVQLASTLLYAPIFMLSLVGCAPCFLRKNVQWNTRAQHVAITRDGIRFIREKRPFCWGLSCTDRGKSSKTVPFDKITDCDLEEPAGNACICCVPRILTVVNVDTASSGGGMKELSIAGLKNPVGFKKLVWAMKRVTAQGSGGGSMSSGVIDRGNYGGGGVDSTGESVTTLLKEIRDEMKVNNALLRGLKNCDTVQDVAPSYNKIDVEKEDNEKIIELL